VFARQQPDLVDRVLPAKGTGSATTGVVPPIEDCLCHPRRRQVCWLGFPQVRTTDIIAGIPKPALMQTVVQTNAAGRTITRRHVRPW
jgi:hypothetical protein